MTAVPPSSPGSSGPTPLNVGDIQYSQDGSTMFLDIKVDGHNVRISGDVNTWGNHLDAFRTNAERIVDADRVAIKQLNGSSFMVNTETWSISQEKKSSLPWKENSYEPLKKKEMKRQLLIFKREEVRKASEMTEFEKSLLRIEESLKKRNLPR